MAGKKKPQVNITDENKPDEPVAPPVIKLEIDSKELCTEPEILLPEKPVDNDADIDPDFFLTPMQKIMKRGE